MKIKDISIFVCLFIGTLAWSFPPKGVKTGPNGLIYKHYPAKKEGRQPHTGDIATVHITARTQSDSVFINTNTGIPADIKLTDPTYRGCFWESFSILKTGDSIKVWVISDSFYLRSLKGERPAFLKAGEEISITIALLKTESEDKVIREKAEKSEKAIAFQSENINKYISDKKLLKVNKTSSGLRYVILKHTDGEIAEQGDAVQVHYTGTLLNGTRFDGSAENKPYQFSLGLKQVIEGWDEGVALMRKGEKFLFIIPFELAYGERENGTISSFSPLVFEIELVDINKIHR